MSQFFRSTSRTSGTGRAARAWVVISLVVGIGCPQAHEGRLAEDETFWTETERVILRSLSLASLDAPPESLSNRFADDPRAAQLGRRLFFDPGLSRNGQIACSTCHDPRHYFTDQRATSRGLGDSHRNAPTIVGAAFSPWQFWDGRRDSLWAQALAPIETAAEMGSSRLAVVRYVTRDEPYRDAYREIFGEAIDLTDQSRFPEHAGPFGSDETRGAWNRLTDPEREAIDRAFANIGKSLEAYERTVLPEPSRFDRYVAAVSGGSQASPRSMLTDDEEAGLRLFMDVGRTQCMRCHNGPLLTNNSFHDIGTGRLSNTPDLGRFLGIQSLRMDPFNCLGPFSDAPKDGCGSLRFLEVRLDPKLIGSFRTPTLRGLTQTAPFFHDGSQETLTAVIDYYRSPPVDPPNELEPLDLSDDEARKLVAFLETLSPDALE